MARLLCILAFVFMASPGLAQDAQEPDCSGFLEQASVAEVGKRSVKRNGRFAVGDMAGNAFIPLLYFNTLAQAKACAGDLHVREFRRGRWIQR